MSSNRRWFHPLACLAVTTGLGGCADYIKHRDTMTSGAGDAHAWNRAVQTTDPWPPYVMNTRIESDGQRVAGAIERYGKAPGQAPGKAPATPPSPATGPAADGAPAKQ